MMFPDVASSVSKSLDIFPPHNLLLERCIPYAAGFVGVVAAYALYRKRLVGPHAELKGVNLAGKVCIVTGGNGGIGKETARSLYQCGAHVIIACRSKTRGEEAIRDITTRTSSKNGGKIEVMELDLSSLESVRKFAANFKARHLPLHILVNNAGVVTVMKPYDGVDPRKDPNLTVDGFETMVATNHLGHFLLTQLLLPVMAQSSNSNNPTDAEPGRIIIVASGAHEFVKGKLSQEDVRSEMRFEGGWAKTGLGTMAAMRRYGFSKLLNIWHAFELQRRIDEHNSNISINNDNNKINVTVNTMCPGPVYTGLGSTAQQKSNLLVRLLLPPLQHLFFKTPAQGAQTTIYLATSPKLTGKGGAFYKNCKPHGTSPLARDVALAKQAWDVSCELLHLDNTKLI